MILTQYYPPETGAPQNRLHSLARYLKVVGHDVKVVTAMPNYPAMRVFQEYRGRFLRRDEIDGVPVHRSWIYASQSRRLLPRLLNYFSFVGSSLFAGLSAGDVDYVVCESPPLFLGLSAAFLARARRASLILNVSDLWPESAERLGIVRDGWMLRAAYRLEAWLYKRSTLVLGQTKGIVHDIRRRFPSVVTGWLPNGADLEVYAGVEANVGWCSRHGLEQKKLFVYAGVLGHAQGLEVMINAALGLRDRTDVAFVIIGDGPRRQALQKLNDTLSAGVVFVPNTPKPELMGIIAAAYACVVPLRKLDLFKGAVPSKLFDPLALGVPVLLGVEGEARDAFIVNGRGGLAFEPENVDQLMECVVRIAGDPNLRDELGANGREFVTRHYDRRDIASTLVERLENLQNVPL